MAVRAGRLVPALGEGRGASRAGDPWPLFPQAAGGLREPWFRSVRRGQPAVMETNEGTEEVVETRGDEHHVVLSADTNGDGKTDVWMTDTTGDGKADLYQFDTTGDGEVDVTMVERAEEAGADRIVVEGDGGHPVES
ncbi:hypothetical protein GCM10010515_50170 [Streptomyces fructofermentans]|uniref:VCBS repeat-containing protein n=2 Tax=Streptomyces fructofermentans TaxID=152141 RepID=A0A918KUL7_9ACTN|nr:hypothetical protein GCM10010515_50170 [Streptomyces fructofermentans]